MRNRPSVFNSCERFGGVPPAGDSRAEIAQRHLLRIERYHGLVFDDKNSPAVGKPAPMARITCCFGLAVGNVHYRFGGELTITCMSWEGERRRASGPADNIRKMPP